MLRFFGTSFLLLLVSLASAQQGAAIPIRQTNTELVDVAPGWANNSVNAVIFRKNSLVTYRDTQFIAFYNKDRYVVVAKRKLGTHNWIIKQTQLRGNAADAHNCISIMVDGNGFLHMAWDHHNNKLHYCRSISPGSLELTDEMPMIGKAEQRVSYPEFFRLANGNLLFLYRDGGSGQGNLIMNAYDITTRQWTRVQDNLVDGQGQRNAYWQVFVDTKGTIHLSWVWRETPDVASNHDMCYARSADGGKTWTTSEGKKYDLPVNAVTAEYAWKIPQKSELINQTSMFADDQGHPYIATYWREAQDSIPQYHLIYKTGKKWQQSDLGFRKTPFSLSGTGTRRIPISRPQIIAWKSGKAWGAALIFRDAERGSRVSVAISKNLKKAKWAIINLTEMAVGSWEPSYDSELWKEKGLMHIFVQPVEQVDGEGLSDTAPGMISVLEWDIRSK
jgi:hypothetical protein